MLNFVKNAPLAAALLTVFSLGIFSCASADFADILPGYEDARPEPSSDLDKNAAAKVAAEDGEIFMPERFEEFAQGQSAFTFKTSKPKAALYINGNYHGLTPLMATGLVPGRYFIQIKKKGFKTVNIAIQVKDGISDFSYIEMEAEDPSNQNASQAQEAAAANPSQESLEGRPVTPSQSQETPAL